MANAPRIWLEYRPVRIGWVIPDRDIARLASAASWSSCLWGGRFNPVLPIHDAALADRLVRVFGVDLLIPIEGTPATQAFVDRFPHLRHNRWRHPIFQQGRCEFADIRHVLRRIYRDQDNEAKAGLVLPIWDQADALDPFFTVLLGRYPQPGDDVADYRAAIRNEFDVPEPTIPANGEPPPDLLEGIPPIPLTAYGMTRQRDPTGWLNPGVVLGSANDFDDLVLFWNLRAAGAPVCFYDQANSARLRSYANGFLDKFRGRARGARGPRSDVNFWFRRQVGPQEDWQPDLNLADIPPAIANGSGDHLWSGLNVQPNRPHFSAWHRDVVPSYSEGNGNAAASFALPDRPFDDDDVQALSQKFVVVVDAGQYGAAGDLTFETPYVPEMNEFYGRNFYFDYDAARAQLGGMNKGAVGIITSISTQRLEVSAYHGADWLAQFFSLCKLSCERSEPGLRCKRLISQFGSLQDCRVLKIRGVRRLLREYGVDQSFTRSGALEAIRDVDPGTQAVGFDEFKHLHIEARRQGGLKPDDVLKYLVRRGVFRVGLEFKCPNCELPSWIHLDDVRTRSTCSYCDHTYDVTPQLKDRDWRYRRSGIFGRDDNQLGGVPVALTLQQLDTSLHDNLIMYSSAMNFRSAGADIEPCESDFVAVVSGALGISESPVQILIGEAKTGKAIDEQDVRKLGKLADAIPKLLAQCFILFSKTETFSAEEVALARSLNSQYERRVILWSRDELEPYFLYERAKDRLGERRYATALTDMANATHQLWFTP
jgi:hypothetical protein